MTVRCLRTTFSSDEFRSGFLLQDLGLCGFSDVPGWCLSMHQPYASLLIAGIKKHEGRNWFHSHRGRLWIHAGAKQPTQEEKENVLRAYRHISPIELPSSMEFSTGVLLGCVDITDCLPQSKYREMFPHGEISDPYVFICEHPHKLRAKFPMKGGAKIFKLDTKLHNVARKQVMFD